MSAQNIRNIAIIAHVDHGKTTLVDQLLRQSGTVAAHREMAERAMDSNELERERGITILSKCTTVTWHDDTGGDWKINIVDTPGHADFGGEVERVLKMVDCVVLVVDAVEGPMPQTRFVLRKSLALGHEPIVVINKIDRDQSRPDEVLNEVFDLFVALDANEHQLDFPVVYASARNGFARMEPDHDDMDMNALFRAIVEHAPPPPIAEGNDFCMQCATLSYDSFVGRLAIGRIFEGAINVGDRITICRQRGGESNVRISRIFGFHGLERVETERAEAGEIVMLAGMDDVLPGDTINQLDKRRRLPAIDIDEPTISMRFMVNTSPFAGREGKYVTSRQLRGRLMEQLERDVSLRVTDTNSPDVMEVSGRGELHLSILIETMRREGFELAVTRPAVITRRDEDGTLLEPMELVVVECGDEFSGTVINKLNIRRGEMQKMEPAGEGMTRLEYRMPARGLIGYRSEFLTDTRGTGQMHTNFDGYEPMRGDVPRRANGALIVMEPGETTGYSLFSLQERGQLFVGPGLEVYAGQVVGEHARDNDLVVNPCKKKQLTNMRASGSDDKLLLTPPRDLSLEAALEWIDDDELVEITPENIRLRKLELDHNKRKAKKPR